MRSINKKVHIITISWIIGFGIGDLAEIGRAHV